MAANLGELTSLIDQMKQQKAQAKAPASSELSDLKTKSQDDSFVEELKKEKQEKAAELERMEMESRYSEAKKKLGKNQILMTEVTSKEPSSKINHVIDVYEDDHFPKEIRGAIPKVDPSFVWNPDDLEALILGKKTGHRVLLAGDPGTGKTSSAQQFAAILKQPFFQFNGKEGVEYASFLGSMGVKGGNTVWNDGVLTQAMKLGCFCCIDEVMKIPPGVQMACQTLYQKAGFVILDDKEGTYEDKLITPKPEFFLVFTDNVKGGGEKLEQFASTSIQDTSSLDRVGITRTTDYLPKKIEAKLLVDRYGISTKDANFLVGFATMVRNAYRKGQEVSLTLSPRGLGAACEIMQAGVSRDTAIELSFLNKLPRDEDVMAAKGFLKTLGA